MLKKHYIGSFDNTDKLNDTKFKKKTIKDLKINSKRRRRPRLTCLSFFFRYTNLLNYQSIKFP